MVLMSGPIFREDDRLSLRIGGGSQNSLGVRRTILAAGSKAADYYPHDVEGLLHNLRFRNRISEIAQKRSRWFGGRLYNYFSGEHPDYIPISGTHLRQALDAAGIEPPSFIANAGKYELRLDVSQQAVLRLAELPDQSTY